MTTPIQVGKLRKGGYVILKEQPCKIVNITTSKTGKHGHAKSVITGINIFNGKKVVEAYSTSHTINVPIVTKIVYQLCNIDRNEVEVLDDNNKIIYGIKIGEDIIEDLTNKFEKGLEINVTVLSALCKSKIIEYTIINSIFVI